MGSGLALDVSRRGTDQSYRMSEWGIQSGAWGDRGMAPRSTYVRRTVLGICRLPIVLIWDFVV